MVGQPLLFRVLVLFQVGPILLRATVFINRAEEGVASCKGTVADIKCTTTTGTGFLLWQNSSGKSFGFDDTATVGAGGTLGSTTMTLNSIEPVSNAVVYTSTATENMIENTTIHCSDGGVLQSIDVTVKSPSSPSWALSVCRFSQGSVRLSWNAPSVAAECCDQYTVQLSTGTVNTTETSVIVLIRNETVNATVYCVDNGGKMVTKTEDMTINTNIAITQVTIEPVSSSCDANTSYQISWATNTSSEEVCTPLITKSIVTCTTSSTNQSSTLCSVPANETVNVTVTIINAVGVTASRSASADVLAQACRRLNSALVSSTVSTPSTLISLSTCTPSMCTPSTLISISTLILPSLSPSGTDTLSPAGIAAVFMGLGLLILAAVCIALVVYIVWNCIKISPQKETYEFKNAVAVMDLPKEEETKQ